MMRLKKYAVSISDSHSTVLIEGESENLEIPREEWGCGMAHKTIKGGLCPGGRLRMERLIDLVRHNRVDSGKLVTYVYHGFDHIEEALLLMKNKPKDLIKPVVIL